MMLEGRLYVGYFRTKYAWRYPVTVGDGTGGMAKGDVDGAGFNGNNLEH
ncbi:hypothetical protein KCP74_14170 [Salmonella enterica subsp. enterica]|nr:hypothetical protein KCP74_14170 [Salmonella enterica subsp. enterica]